MPENRFEDDARQTLGGLRIRPTADVWTRLEKELRQRRKRRFAFFFFIVAGLLLAGSVTYLFTIDSRDEKVITESANRSNKKATTEPHNENEKTSIITDSTSVTSNIGSHDELQPAADGVNSPERPDARATGTDAGDLAGNDAGKPDTDKAAKIGSNDITRDGGSRTKATAPSVSDGVKKPAATGQGAATRQPITKPVRSQQQDVVRHDRIAADDSHEKDAASHSTDIAKQPLAPQHADSGNKDAMISKQPLQSQQAKSGNNDAMISKQLLQPQKANPRINDSMVAKQPLQPQQGNSRISDSMISKQPVADAKKRTDTIANTTAIVKKSNPSLPKRQWVIGFTAGASITGKLMNKSPFSDPGGQQSYNSPPGIPSNFAAIVGPSTSRAGFSFQVSGGMQRAISKRSSLFAGLAYSYATNRIRVGDYQTLATTSPTASPALNIRVQAYAGYPNQSFTDQYHFVMVPIRYQFILNPASRLRIQWNAGLTPGFLFSTDALLYSPELGGSYYRDRHAYNRVRLDASTGFDFMPGRGKIKWSVGPVFNFSLNKLSDNKYDNQQHLFYGGLTGKFYFGE